MSEIKALAMISREARMRSPSSNDRLCLKMPPFRRPSIMLLRDIGVAGVAAALATSSVDIYRRAHVS